MRKSHGVGTSYVPNNRSLFDRLVPLLDCLEFTPDTLLRRCSDGVELDPFSLGELREYSAHVTLAAHGIGLSIGTAQGWNEDYLRHLDGLFNTLPIAWHSEHLAFSHWDGAALGTMLPLPRTREVIEMLCDRIAMVQQRYGVPFLLENIAQLLPEPAAEFDAASFLNRLCEESGCGLLLDIYNLECEANNIGLDIDGFLQNIDPRFVNELHVAKGVVHDGIWLDVHSRSVSDETLDRTKAFLERGCQNLRATVFEFLVEAVPTLGRETIVDQVGKLREALQ